MHSKVFLKIYCEFQMENEKIIIWLNFVKLLFNILEILSFSATHCSKYRNIIIEYFKRIVYSLYIFLFFFYNSYWSNKKSKTYFFAFFISTIWVCFQYTTTSFTETSMLYWIHASIYNVKNILYSNKARKKHKKNKLLIVFIYTTYTIIHLFFDSDISQGGLEYKLYHIVHVPNIVLNDNEHWCGDQINKNRRHHKLHNS